MTAEKAFNNRIDVFLNEDPKSSASLLVQKILNKYPHNNNYHTALDNFCLRIGLRFLNKEILNNKSKTIGYIPYFKYSPHNLLNEEPRIEELVEKDNPMSSKGANTFLAKELVYKLMRVKNIEELLVKV